MGDKTGKGTAIEFSRGEARNKGLYCVNFLSEPQHPAETLSFVVIRRRYQK
jgi:hypothetical protein